MHSSLSGLDPFFTAPPHSELPTDLSDAVAAIAAFRERLHAPERRVVLFGVLKSGKSSLLNALLGRRLLPVHARRGSGAVVTLRHGSSPRTELIREDQPGDPIPPAEVAGALLHDAASGLHIHEVRIEMPHLLFANGCVLVDTPGLIGDETFATRTLREVERTDLGIMVLAADKILSAREREIALWATELLNGNVIYVVNRLDLVDEDDREDVLAWARNALRATGNQIVGQPRIIATSATRHDGIAELGWRLTELMDSQTAARLATLSRLGALEHRLREAQHLLATHSESVQQETQRTRKEHDGEIARQRTAIRGDIAQTRVRLRAAAETLPVIGEQFVVRCVEATRQWTRSHAGESRIPVQYADAITDYTGDVTSAAQDALIGSPVTAPLFDLSTWILRDWIEPATHPTREVGSRLGDLATRVLDGGATGREAGENLGTWLGKTVFHVDVEHETEDRIRRIATTTVRSLEAEARRYLDRVDGLLTDADTYYASWSPSSAKVAAAEEVEGMYESLGEWLDGFLKAVDDSTKVLV